MYKDVLARLNRDRYVDNKFIERLEKNGFEIKYGKFEYWDGKKYIEIGKSKIWLVETYCEYGSMGCCYRYRNDVVEEIKEALEEEKNRLDEEEENINDFLEV